MFGWVSDIFFNSAKDSVKLDKAEIAVITFLSAAIAIPSLMFCEAPKSSAVMIRILSWSYGLTVVEVFIMEVQEMNRNMLIDVVISQIFIAYK